ncbi:hypothetical protein RO3G_03039 [Rhizopus delemar RA 99-880]|uniref:DH domain-containing protein n=1 Tax=Rhizopus delemar (strain RA 99-880 / ATCC MYA-4621 / FGSC 9543 / NRRL 43880) TaxID=246409 RepID=I1BQ55_RHIO9|nr:hypothetical protein RO3G_03039 [Rhizopus delemar RA 99-880]|eukprot:EIE78335.1 hypothetical protein RO3G_03039 [Rhizopus delemar RA 99-880]
MSAIVTHFGFDASKEEIRAMSMWRDKVTEISQPCLCSQSDCLYQFILDPNLFQERPIMEQQRFSKKPLPKDTAMRKFILNELIETEKTYNQLLNLIHTAKIYATNEKPDELGKVLQETEPKFSIFLKYTIHYKHNEKQIRKACNNILFIKINQKYRKTWQEEILID